MLNNTLVLILGSLLGHNLFTLITNKFLAVLLGIAFIFLLRFLQRYFIKKVFNEESFLEEFKAHDWLTHTVFLGSFIVKWDIQSSIPLFYILALSHLVAFIIYVLFLINKNKNIISQQKIQIEVSLLFFVSGFSALIYQIAWQRALFQIYGLNTESVTIIVSIFMLGLGLGSILGGFLSRKFPDSLIQIFLFFELGVAIFGFFSLSLTHQVGNSIVLMSTVKSSVIIFLLFLFPTMCMGATLPVLVDYLYKISHNIGNSLSRLYFINTLGSAIASFVTVDLLFIFFGLQDTIYVAVTCNIVVSILVIVFVIKHKKSIEPVAKSEEKNEFRIPFFAAIILSFIVGYISLSQEILWVRAIGYATNGLPQIFGQILGAVLLGVAFGASFADYLCNKKNMHPLLLISSMLLISSLLYFFALPLIAFTMTLSLNLGFILSLCLIVLIAMTLGGVLIILSHYSIKASQKVGFAISWIYLANIIGATMGPIFTEFILLDNFTLAENILGLILFCISSAFILTFFYPAKLSKTKKIFAIISILCLFFVGIVHHSLYDNVLAKLQFKKAYTPGMFFKSKVENRSGIITTVEDQTISTNPYLHIVFGGGVFDGEIDAIPKLDENMPDGLGRLFMIGLIHQKPLEILQIAMSGGMWTKIISGYENTNHIDVVEINPGYLELAKNYPRYDLLSNNPKVTIHIDDGRRWLRRNPNKKYDLIVFNTPHHYRSQISSLLSTEFIKLCKAHLKQNGVYYQTVTGSEDAIYTGAQNFKHIIKIYNMYAGSDSPFNLTNEQKKENLLKFKYYSKPIFTESKKQNQKLFEELLNFQFIDLGNAYRSGPRWDIVTDDNMLTEFKKSHSRLAPYYQWKKEL